MKKKCVIFFETFTQTLEGTVEEKVDKNLIIKVDKNLYDKNWVTVNNLNIEGNIQVYNEKEILEVIYSQVLLNKFILIEDDIYMFFTYRINYKSSDFSPTNYSETERSLPEEILDLLKKYSKKDEYINPYFLTDIIDAIEEFYRISPSEELDKWITNMYSR